MELLKLILNVLPLENNFPPFLIDRNSPTFHMFKFKRVLYQLEYKHYIGQTSKVHGFHMCITNKLRKVYAINLFHCKKGGYIMFQYVCDGFVDCPNDKTDEVFCTCNRSDTYNSQTCKDVYFSKTRKECSHMYQMTMKEKCIKYRNIWSVRNQMGV